MKIHPQEIADFKDDVQGVMRRHPDLLTQEATIREAITEARDLADTLFRRVTENQSNPTTENVNV